MQDRFRCAFAHIVQHGEDDAWLVWALLHLGWVEGKAAHRRAHRYIVGAWVVYGACLGKRHVEVEVVRPEHFRRSRLRVIAVDTRFAYHPDVALVVFHHALHDALVVADVPVKRGLQVVLQQVGAADVLQHSTQLRYQGLSVAVLHDEVYVVG